MRQHQRLAATVTVAVFLSAWVTASAAAHAVMQPPASRPADLQRYTLTVPNERGVPTNEIRMEVPTGIDFFLVEAKLGWKVNVERKNGRVVAVDFTGGAIAPDYYDTFRFIAKNPVKSGTIAWKVVQSYVGGEVVSWTGHPGSDTPAARTTINETAVPVDTVDVNSGKPPAAPAGAASAGGGHDTLALVLAIVALAVGMVGAAAGLFRGRPLV